MENLINDIILKIRKSNNLNINDLNKVIELHKIVDKRQSKRLEMLIKDKLQEINVYLNENFLNNLEKMLFDKKSKSNIVDLRLINKNEIAIIRNDEIELGNLSYNIDELNDSLMLQEEAYAFIYHNTGKEPDYVNPEEVFSDFYNKIKNNIQALKYNLNLQNRDIKIYFDRKLDSFYFDNPKSFKMIITELPNIIEIYEINETQDKWIPNRINGDYLDDLMSKYDFSLLNKNFIIENAKQNIKYKSSRNSIKEIDIEIALDEFKEKTFSTENLIKTYNKLFKNNNCMLEENESAITRLEYITLEKLIEQGYNYEKAFNYTKLIFETIKSYKIQIINAINGEDKFPNDSLVGTVKKLKKSSL